MSLDTFEFKRTVYLGEQVSTRHPFFQIIAKLGYSEAETEAFISCIEEIEKKDLDMIGILRLLNTKIGMAHFLPNTKEITRLALIMGKTTKRRKAKRGAT